MKEFKTTNGFYDFYELPEEERMQWIGTPFKVTNRHSTEDIYFPIGLDLERCHNYGKTPGLLRISRILHYKYQTKKLNYEEYDWFRVGIASPDDDDYDLDFKGEYCKYREDVIKFLTEAPYGPWTNTTYKDVLELVNEYTGNVGEYN